MSIQISNKRQLVNGVEIFYREAGNRKNPAVLLLHGFPTSSVMFKNLMTALADKYYLVAPDYPGFGFSDFPDQKHFSYSFDNIAAVMAAFAEAIGLDRFFIYLHDYGATIGLRLCLRNPAKILGLIVQNGNAYEEGLGPQWDETKDYWANPAPEKKERFMSFLSEEGTKAQYVAGLPDHLLPRVGPELWTLDWTLMSRPGNIDMQAELNFDYRNNPPLFKTFQAYFRDNQPPALVIWGRYDVFFSVEEAHCYQLDLPAAELHILEAGHMPLETNFDEVSALISAFLERHTSS
ncbi:hydrolase [Pedobacter yulinensis]|uniref:Hydrolase n=1 Tax=Pedobacter yulinensis TaxID=2126353 RepID=A0A2T3HMG5_9SPHI|nr:alpha/beta hydrolase [Pedobacter yulinensis]PST83627.1 hydrolase [Pedobacter yulinensis]